MKRWSWAQWPSLETLSTSINSLRKGANSETSSEYRLAFFLSVLKFILGSGWAGNTEGFSAYCESYQAIIVRSIPLNNQKKSNSQCQSFRNKYKITWDCGSDCTLLGMYYDLWLLSRGLNGVCLGRPVPSHLTWAGLSLPVYHHCEHFKENRCPISEDNLEIGTTVKNK